VNGIWRPESLINSGNVLFGTSGVFNGFTIVSQPTPRTLIIKTSGTLGEDAFGGPGSAAAAIKASAYYQVTGTRPTVTIQAFTPVQNLVAASNIVVELGSLGARTNRFVLTLSSGAVFADEAVLRANSGLFVFDVTSISAVNSEAIKSGISTLERVSDTVVVITPSSGIVGATFTAAHFELTSGLFIQTLQGPQTVAVVASNVPVSVVNSGVNIGADDNAVKLAITIADGTFRTVAQGFDPSQITITGSGATAAALAIANSNASAIKAALNNGQYGFDSNQDTIEIFGFGLLDILASSISVSISRSALLAGTATPDDSTSHVRIATGGIALS
jgi:hypothetical protein